MVSFKRAGTRVSAGAFVVGLSLMGPQALGVAVADIGDADSSATAESPRVAPATRGRDAGKAADRAVGAERSGRTPRAAAVVRPDAGTPSGRGDSGAPRAGSAVQVRVRATAVDSDLATSTTAAQTTVTMPATSTAAAQTTVATPTTSTASAQTTVATPATSTAAVPAAVAARSDAPVARQLAATTFLDHAVNQFFDSAENWLASLPAGPITEFLEGSLLLVRRTLFNRMPTTSRPTSYLTTAAGEFVGGVGAFDPDGDALRYTLGRAPDYGTVTFAADGTYTYTPGPDYAGGDLFTVNVADRGFNLLTPFADRSREVTVQVPNAAPVAGYTNGWNVRNFTGDTVVFSELRRETGYEDAVEGAPPIGTVLQPGDTAHFELTWYSFSSYDTRPVFTGPAGQQWVVNFRTLTGGDGSFQGCDVGDCGYYDQREQSQWFGAELRDPVGTTDFYADTPGAAELLSTLLSLGWNATYGDVTFDGQQPNDPGWNGLLRLDNASDNPQNSGTRTVSSSFSATKTTSQKCSVPNCDYGLNIATAKKLITTLITKKVSNNYSVSESETESKTFTTTISQGLLPWSANQVLTAPQILNVNGDVVIDYYYRYYVFHDMAFLYPSPTESEPIHQFFSEPLQPKKNGMSVANVGFTVKDPNSELLDPTYKAGKQIQLQTTAFNGFGSGENSDFTRRAVYSSSNPAVAAVNGTGVLTTKAAGTTTITARYDWAMPLGGGEVRSDYVIATMVVTVK